jgi:hypothetical protein
VINKNREKNGFGFLVDFFVKCKAFLLSVFRHDLLCRETRNEKRETPDNVLKKKQSRLVGGWVWDSEDIRAGAVGPSMFCLAVLAYRLQDDRT